MVKHSATQKSHSRGKNTSEKVVGLKGVRMRKWGKWVSEVRIPNSRRKIWLGSYSSPLQAARAFDCAVYCLRGSNAKFNFPQCLPHFSPASCLSLSPEQIQAAAAKFALQDFPQASLPSSSEESQQISEEEGVCALLDFLLDDSEAAESSNVEEHYQLDMTLQDLQIALFGDEDRERTEILPDF